MKTTITTTELTYCKETRSFATEASSLGFPVGMWPVSFTLVNPKTGGQCIVTGRKTHRDGDGDVTRITYTGICQGKPITLEIFND
jgi:hypothetical protein